MLSTQIMEAALECAKQAAVIGEVPVGAVVVQGDKIIAAAHNVTVHNCDPCGHAEIIALRQAAKVIGSPRLNECDLYVTLEPCPMCAHAISIARIRRLYFGAFDLKGGGVEHGPRIFNQPTCFHRPEVYSCLLEQECSKILKEFFHLRRSE